MKVPLLLDTCVLVWMVSQDLRGTRALAALDAAMQDGTGVCVSPYSAWEMAMLVAKGRLSLTLPLRLWFSRMLSASGISLADATPDVLIAANELPWIAHGDPADRILIATAREYGLRILTHDRKILDYAAKGHVMALAC